MAGGQYSKFHGSEVKLLTEYNPSGSSAPTISAITAADPPVVTTSTHSLETGDVVRFSTDVGGMTELRGVTAVVEVLSATTFSLPHVTASGYAAYTSGGHIDVGVFTNFCELTNYNRAGGSSPEIPTVTLCSTAAEFTTGLPDFGTTTLDYNFAPETTVQEALDDSHRNGTITAIRVILPEGHGDMTQLGFVQSSSEQAGVGTIWTGSTTIRNTGPRYDVADD